ncbi:MAG: UDP-N-acetylmuramate--L-alanine ligase [Flavobacteriales bacterium]
MSKITHLFFLGIGGIGMSALARYFRAQGKSVSGYDKTPSSLTDELINEQIKIIFKDELPEIAQIASLPKENVLIVYTPAIPSHSILLNFFLNNDYDVVKRSRLLGMITENQFTVAVAGTHGKTTTSSLIAHILHCDGKRCNAFLGGISTNYNSNLILSNKDNPVAVTEADEYDRSFLTLNPNIAIVTSMDADHLDIYGKHNALQMAFNEFAQRIKPEGILIKKEGLTVNTEKTFSYNVKGNSADVYPLRLGLVNGLYRFDVQSPQGVISNLELGLPGLHNVENALAAILVCQLLNVPEHTIREALQSFAGVKRRFEYIIRTEKLIFIDDYAHHPEELSACINSVKAIYPNKRITGVFQPHLYTRTRDFATSFSNSLSLLDEVLLLDIYPAREVAIPGVNSTMLLNEITSDVKKLVSKTELESEVLALHPEVLLTLGAGDIDRLIEPLKQKLLIEVEA